MADVDLDALERPRSAYERATNALAARQRIVAISNPRRYYERGCVVDNGERGSAQKTNIDNPFDWDDLSALVLDHDALIAELRRLRGQMTDAARLDQCHHCGEQTHGGEPCWWCGRRPPSEWPGAHEPKESA